jgi:Holliday junction resolvasome RuvABC endonuclease subunit
MDKQQIKEAILKAAGNPESGAIADFADAMAEAVTNIDKPVETKKFNPVAETRITEISETR